MELLLSQVGQASAMVTVTLFPFLVFVRVTCLPQRADRAERFPYLSPSIAAIMSLSLCTVPQAPASNVNTGGFATFFYQNGVAGACGTVHGDNDMIAAIDGDRYGDLAARSALCGKQVKLTNTKNGKSVTVTIADACPTCDNSNSIDLSKGAFEQIATVDEGIVPITWSFV